MQKSEGRQEKKNYKGRVNARGVPKSSRNQIGYLGEPGRFRMMGHGIKQGVKHFST